MRRYQDIPTTERNAVVEAMLEEGDTWGDVAAALGYPTAARARAEYVDLKRRQSSPLKALPIHPVDFERRCQRIHDLRFRGVKWKDVIADTGYTSIESANRAYVKWLRRHNLVAHPSKAKMPRNSTDVHVRCVRMDEMRKEGYSWADISVELGYASGDSALQAYYKWRDRK